MHTHIHTHTLSLSLSLSLTHSPLSLSHSCSHPPPLSLSLSRTPPPPTTQTQTHTHTTACRSVTERKTRTTVMQPTDVVDGAIAAAKQQKGPSSVIAGHRHNILDLATQSQPVYSILSILWEMAYSKNEGQQKMQSLPVHSIWLFFERWHTARMRDNRQHSYN